MKSEIKLEIKYQNSVQKQWSKALMKSKKIGY